jgi:hypothetical protein
MALGKTENFLSSAIHSEEDESDAYQYIGPSKLINPEDSSILESIAYLITVPDIEPGNVIDVDFDSDVFCLTLFLKEEVEIIYDINNVGYSPIIVAYDSYGGEYGRYNVKGEKLSMVC